MYNIICSNLEHVFFYISKEDKEDEIGKLYIVVLEIAHFSVFTCIPFYNYYELH